MNSLPLEIIRLIISPLEETHSALFALSRVNHAWNREAEMIVYKECKIQRSTHGQTSANFNLFRFLTSIINRSQREKYVQSLEISIRLPIAPLLRLLASTLPRLFNLQHLAFNPEKAPSAYLEWVLLNLPPSLRKLRCDIVWGPSLWMILKSLPHLRHLFLIRPLKSTMEDNSDCAFPNDVGLELSTVRVGVRSLESLIPPRFINDVTLIDHIPLSDLEDVMKLLQRSNRPISKLSFWVVGETIDNTCLHTISRYNPYLTSLTMIASLETESMTAFSPNSGCFQHLRDLHIVLNLPNLSSPSHVPRTLESWTKAFPRLSSAFLRIYGGAFDSESIETRWSAQGTLNIVELD